MRKCKAALGKDIVRLVLGVAGLAAISAVIALIITKLLRRREEPGAACTCEGCADDDEYCDENGCCYTDERNFV